MPRNPKAVQDDVEAEADDIAEAQAEMAEQIDDELAMWDAAIAYGHIPGLSSFGFPIGDEDYATYVGPSYSYTKKEEQDMSCSKEDWKEFLRKIEEDLE